MSHALIHPLVPLRERPQHFLEKLKKYKTLKVSREGIRSASENQNHAAA